MKPGGSALLSKAPCKRSNIVGCYMLRPFAHPVACCCAKFETGQTLQPTTPNISFVPWSPKRSATMLDPFAQLFQHCSGATHAHYAWITKTYELCSSHDALQVPNLLVVVASVCTPLLTRTQQLPTLLVQQCWELLHPFAPSLIVSVRSPCHFFPVISY